MEALNNGYESPDDDIIIISDDEGMDQLYEETMRETRVNPPEHNMAAGVDSTSWNENGIDENSIDNDNDTDSDTDNDQNNAVVKKAGIGVKNFASLDQVNVGASCSSAYNAGAGCSSTSNVGDNDHSSRMPRNVSFEEVNVNRGRSASGERAARGVASTQDAAASTGRLVMRIRTSGDGELYVHQPGRDNHGVAVQAVLDAIRNINKCVDTFLITIQSAEGLCTALSQAFETLVAVKATNILAQATNDLAQTTGAAPQTTDLTPTRTEQTAQTTTTASTSTATQTCMHLDREHETTMVVDSSTQTYITMDRLSASVIKPDGHCCAAIPPVRMALHSGLRPPTINTSDGMDTRLSTIVDAQIIATGMQPSTSNYCMPSTSRGPSSVSGRRTSVPPLPRSGNATRSSSSGPIRERRKRSSSRFSPVATDVLLSNTLNVPYNSSTTRPARPPLLPLPVLPPSPLSKVPPPSPQ